jgi:hypothetical protein
LWYIDSSSKPHKGQTFFITNSITKEEKNHRKGSPIKMQIYKKKICKRKYYNLKKQNNPNNPKNLPSYINGSNIEKGFDFQVIQSMEILIPLLENERSWAWLKMSSLRTALRDTISAWTNLLRHDQISMIKTYSEAW